MSHKLDGTSRERGDTLIEVLVAIAVFGVVVVGAFSLMNRGVAQVYDSMEKSEVRLLLNRQVESLTYARDQHQRLSSNNKPTTEADIRAATLWSSLAGRSIGAVPALDNCNNTNNAFWVNVETSGTGVKYISLTTSSLTPVALGFPSPGNGIWIQEIDSPAASPISTVPYKDFYVRACWMQNSSPQTIVLSTVVRLYDR